MKRMLINATHAEELRVAIVDGQRLYDLDIENKSRQQKKSNIYKAKITRIEPSLEAAFVDYGAERHGFLPFKEIAREYLAESAFAQGGRPNVKDGISEGKEIIVQIEKEERGNKGAALTTFISLAGRFLVLMPNNPRAGGVSRRIEGEDRANLRAAMNDVTVPQEMGTIVRTAGIGRTSEELQWDLDYQIDIWKAIRKAAQDKAAPFLIYQESNVIVRALRDNFRSDIGEILIDEPDVFRQAEEFINRYMPHNSRKLKLYQEEIPLFSRFQIESQIESAFQREVQLPSGGAIVIDHSEALISIDINSARATKGSDIEETATNTNLEACDEISRQLRLRDIGGLIVIDFIDMLANKNQRKVEGRLKEVMKADRARVQIGRISRFGLLEMSRQRLRPSLGESSQTVCPRCTGHGTIRGVESLALSILRLLEEEAMKDNTDRVLVQVPIDVSSYLVNEKRENIAEIESRTQAKLLVVASPGLETPHFQMERIRGGDVSHDSEGKKSYELSIHPDEPYVPHTTKPQTVRGESPAVMRVDPEHPAPLPAVKTYEKRPAMEAGVVTKIIGAFSNLFSAEPKAEEKKQEEEKQTKSTRSDRGQSRRSRNSGAKQDRSESRSTGTKQRRGRPARKSQKAERNGTKADTEQATLGPENGGANEEKKTRSKARNKKTAAKRGQTESRGKDKNPRQTPGKKEDPVSENAGSPNSDESQVASPEKATDKSKPASKRQRQGSNYNRSRRQSGAKDDSSTADTKANGGKKSAKSEESPGEETRNKESFAKPAKTKDEQLTDSRSRSKDSKDRPERPSPVSDSADVPENPATEQPSDVDESAVNSTKNDPGKETGTSRVKRKRVSSKQPSQLKSTVRSLANKSGDETNSGASVAEQEKGAVDDSKSAKANKTEINQKDGTDAPDNIRIVASEEGPKSQAKKSRVKRSMESSSATEHQEPQRSSWGSPKLSDVEPVSKEEKASPKKTVTKENAEKKARLTEN